MASVVHFSVDGEIVACGARVYLCEDYTSDRHHVDCKRCRRTTWFKTFDPTRYNVDVWNHEGDVIDHERSVTADEVDDIRERYAGDPVDVIATECAPAGV